MARPLDQIDAEHDRAMEAIDLAIRELMEKVVPLPEGPERTALMRSALDLIGTRRELAAQHIADVANSAEVQEAISRLQHVTAELQASAKQLRDATDIVGTAGKVVSQAKQVVPVLKSILPAASANAAAGATATSATAAAAATGL